MNAFIHSMIESHQFYWGKVRMVYSNILHPLQLFRSRINQSCGLQKFPSVQNIKTATRSLLFAVFGHRLLTNITLRYDILLFINCPSDFLPVALLSLMMMRPSSTAPPLQGSPSSTSARVLHFCYRAVPPPPTDSL